MLKHQNPNFLFFITGECQLNLGEILSDPTMSKMLMGGGTGGLGGLGGMAGLGGGLGGLGGGLGGELSVSFKRLCLPTQH